MLTVIDEAVDHLEEWAAPAVVKPSPKWYTVAQLFRYGEGLDGLGECCPSGFRRTCVIVGTKPIGL